jgi:biuret amidohydrolase
LLLRIRGVRNLILTGVCTDICVHTTMREAADKGYDCVLVRDACGATVEGLHCAGVDMVGTEGGIFGTVCETKDLVEVLETLKG